MVQYSVDEEHKMDIQTVEDEYFVHLSHPMTKQHYISFIAAVSDDTVQFKKLYPESDAEARFIKSGIKYFYYYCNRHGLFIKNKE